jgi:hypothetical protein
MRACCCWVTRKRWRVLFLEIRYFDWIVGYASASMSIFCFALSSRHLQKGVVKRRYERYTLQRGLSPSFFLKKLKCSQRILTASWARGGSKTHNDANSEKEENVSSSIERKQVLWEFLSFGMTIATWCSIRFCWHWLIFCCSGSGNNEEETSNTQTNKQKIDNTQCALYNI